MPEGFVTYRPVWGHDSRGPRRTDEWSEMVPRQVLAALRAGWWLVLVGLLVGGAAAFGVSKLQTPLYASHTRFFVSTTDSDSTAAVLQGNQFSTQRAASYAQLITGRDLAQQVAGRLGSDASP